MLRGLERLEFHLWLLRAEEPAFNRLLQAAPQILPTVEMERSGVLVSGKARNNFMARRAFVRTVLSQYASVSPADWTIGVDSDGKPEVIAPKSNAPLFFSLSRSVGLVACLVGSDRELGLDVETIDQTINVEAIADQYLAPAEARFLTDLPAAHRLKAFLKLWTLKESYLKARGVGLSLPTEGFCFSCDAAEIELAGEPGKWCFRIIEPDPQHVAAIALPRTSSEKEDKWRRNVTIDIKFLAYDAS